MVWNPGEEGELSVGRVGMGRNQGQVNGQGIPQVGKAGRYVSKVGKDGKVR